MSEKDKQNKKELIEKIDKALGESPGEGGGGGVDFKAYDEASDLLELLSTKSGVSVESGETLMYAIEDSIDEINCVQHTNAHPDADYLTVSQVADMVARAISQGNSVLRLYSDGDTGYFLVCGRSLEDIAAEVSPVMSDQD